MKTIKIITACILTIVSIYAKAQTSCQAYFYTSQTGYVVQLHDTSYSSTPSGGSITYAYSWTFGDGSSSSLKSPTHTYANQGSYYVCLRFSVLQSGVTFCTDSFCKTIVVGCANPPAVTITGVSLVNAGQSTVLTAVATGGTSPYQYAWSNSKYTVKDTVTPTGTNTYCVTVYDNLQCSATACHVVQVNTSTLTPNAINDSACTSPNTVVTVLPLTNDTNLDTLASISIVGTPSNASASVSGKALIISPLQAGFAYVYYKVCNGNGRCDTAQVKVLAGNCGSNNPPIAQAYTTQHCNDSAIYMNASAFSSDPDPNTTLTYTVIGQPQYGTTQVFNTYIKYTPNGVYTGQDVIEYKVCDNGTPSLCDTNYIYLYMSNCNLSTLKPNANNDSVCTSLNTAVTIVVLANDSDLTSPSISIVGTPSNCSVSVSGNNVIATPLQSGQAYFYYKVCNSNGKCDTARVKIIIGNCGSVNNPPIAQPYTIQHCKDSMLYMNAATFTSDPDPNTTLTYSVIGQPQYGTSQVFNSYIKYTPNGVYTGQDFIKYKVCDNGTPSLCDTNYIYLYIYACNTSTVKPIAVDDTVCTKPNTAILIYALSNDRDLDNSPSISMLGTSSGTVTTNNTTKAFEFNPTTGFTGAAVFYYKVCNSNNKCDTGRVVVNVDNSCGGSTNNPPVAQAHTVLHCNDSLLYMNATTFTSDPDPNTTLTYSVIGQPQYGTALVYNTYIKYTPNGVFTGQDIIKYRVCDNGTPSLCDTDFIYVLLSNCNPSTTKPIAVDDTVCTKPNTGINIFPLTNDRDLDNTPSISLIATSTGTVTTNYTTKTFEFIPTNGFSGTAVFYYRVCNSNNKCDTGRVVVNVTTACGGISQPCRDTVCGVVFSDTNGNGVKDAGEAGIANTYVYSGNSTALSDSTGYYQLIIPCGLNHIYAYPNPNQYCCVVSTVPLRNPNDSSSYSRYELKDSSGTRICGFNFGYQNTGVTISGYIYADGNNNGVKDPGETPIANQVVLIAGVYVYTNINGYYILNVPAGTYNLTCTPYAPYAGVPVNPSSITLAATTVGATYTNNNFGLYVQQSVNLSVSISQYSTVTPGYPAYYWVNVCNVGTVATGGIASMYYDPQLIFNNASPAQASYNASAQTLTFNVPTLAPGACTGYFVRFNAPTSLTVGSPIFNLVTVTSTINPDVDLTNNVDTIHQLVTGSWDPNNKLANGSYTYPTTSTKYILPNTDIEYTINFQNTGTAPAVDIIVKDDLQANVDANSFKMLGASHDCQVVRIGSNLNFKFSNIMLPDSTSSEARSHGFVRFSVRPITAAVGTTINNTAQIFFDYNDAVATNTTENVIAVTTGIDGATGATDIVVAPNPFSQYTIISVKGAVAEAMDVTVFDLAGRIASKQTYSNPENMRFDRNELSKGVYVYELTQQGKLIGKGKMVIE